MIDTKPIIEKTTERLIGMYSMHAGFPSQGELKQREDEQREVLDLCREVDTLRTENEELGGQLADRIGAHKEAKKLNAELTAKLKTAEEALEKIAGKEDD